MKRMVPIAALLPALLLAACGEGPKSVGSAPPPKAADSDAHTWIGREKVGKALALLEKGNAAVARKMLIDVLDRQPGDDVARSLVKQIDTDPKVLLGTESFGYISREGDSFSALAQRYLGNPTLFYALARYNGMAVPADLAKGTPLRIPGRERREAPPAPRAVPAPRPAADMSRPVVPPRPAAPATDPRRAAQLRAQGLEQMNRGAIVRAVALLEQANRLDPDNALIKRDLERAIRIRHTVQARH